MMQMVKEDFENASISFQATADVASKHPEVMEDGEATSALTSAKANLQLLVVRVGGAPPLSAAWAMVGTAKASRDWPGVLRWESRLEELLLAVGEASHPQLISWFAEANFKQGLFDKAASLLQRRVQVLGNLERFREQGEDMCHVGECFVHLNDAKGAETWYHKARKLGEKHGCYAVECAACLGLGRVELHIRGRTQEAEELLRHALSVLDFVEGKDETLERRVKTDLSNVLLQTNRYEEAGPLIQRLRDLAERASADPLDMVTTLELAVTFQLRREDVEQAWTGMQVLLSDPIFQPPPSDSRNPDPTSHLRHNPNPQCHTKP
jgi:tetratricopeptide (TPR) repeat protein